LEAASHNFEFSIFEQIEFFRKYRPASLTGPINRAKQGGLHQILTDDVIDEYNWPGSRKKPLKDLFLFNTVLFGDLATCRVGKS
jgi:hypothetical protein